METSGNAHPGNRHPHRGGKQNQKKKSPLAKVNLHGKVIHVESPYSEVTVERFRKLQGQWDPKARVWKLPYEHRDKIISILKNQGMRVDSDVPGNLEAQELNVREAAAEKIRSALSHDPRRRQVSAKMMRQLTELGMEDIQEDLKRKERQEKYGIDKTDWRISNINSSYWNRMKKRKIT